MVKSLLIFWSLKSGIQIKSSQLLILSKLLRGQLICFFASHKLLQLPKIHLSCFMKLLLCLVSNANFRLKRKYVEMFVPMSHGNKASEKSHYKPYLFFSPSLCTLRQECLFPQTGHALMVIPNTWGFVVVIAVVVVVFKDEFLKDWEAKMLPLLEVPFPMRPKGWNLEDFGRTFYSR